MIYNYLKIAWRNIKLNKTYSLINIAGLTLGLASCLIVMTIVINEYSYDRQWNKANQIFRILTNNDQTGERSLYSHDALGPELKRNFPEVLAYNRMSTNETSIQLAKNKLSDNIVQLSAEKSVFEILDLKILDGNPKENVPDITNIVLTQSFKEKHFPDSNPVGKIIKNYLYDEKGTPLLVTGIVADIPYNSHLRSDILMIKDDNPERNSFNNRANGFASITQYVMLAPGVDMEKFSTKINTWYQKQMEGRAAHTNFSFQPITEVYLKSDFASNQLVRGNYTSVVILSGVALLLLLIACINFINLSTARALKRIKETGVRKVLGAGKPALIMQFLTESLLFFVISFVLCIALYKLSLPVLESFVGKQLSLTFIDNITLLFTVLGTVFLISILTGIYPALVLSRPKPTSILTNTHQVNKGSEYFRKSLVMVQFIITIVIIVSTLGVYQQLKFINTKDLGYEKDNLIKLDDAFWSVNKKAFKNAVLQLPGVEQATLAPSSPSSILQSNGSMMMSDPLSENSKIRIDFLYADPDLLTTFKLRLIQGKDLQEFISKMNPEELDSIYGDKNNNTISGYSNKQPVLITQYTAERLGIKELNKPSNYLQGIPVGIIDNFYNESLRNPLKPQVIQASPDVPNGNLFVRLSPKNQNSTIFAIAKTFKEFFPNKTFGYSYVEDVLAQEYRAESKLQTILLSFSLLIVFLSCLGLFGLMTYTIQNRTKEISIRKVLGASILQIWTLLSHESLALLILSVLVAIPISWYGLQQWLREFPYHVELTGGIFILGSGIALCIAFCTISIRIIASAKANPAKNLRNE